MGPIRTHMQVATVQADQDRVLQDYRYVWTDMRYFYGKIPKLDCECLNYGLVSASPASLLTGNMSSREIPSHMTIGLATSTEE